VLWLRHSMWEQSVELGAFDRWVITTLPRWRIQHWLESGMVLVPAERVWLSIERALSGVHEGEVRAVWESLFPYLVAGPGSVSELAAELAYRASDSVPMVFVFERLIERGWRAEPLVWRPRPLPARTQSEHYVEVRAVDRTQAPVAGVRLELLIADGEIRSARTNALGVARVERVQAGRVVIRVLELDGALWRPLDGDASEPSSTDSRLCWHRVSQGECLARIAHRYGLESWKDLWNHAKNAGLRKKRHSPHVLRPGDEVAIPGVQVHEITRSTDATHAIEVQTGRAIKVRVRVQDLAGEPVADLSYDHGYLLHGAPVRQAGSAPTDARGWLEEIIPINADPLVVTVRKTALSFALPISRLDPVHEEDSKQPIASGIHMRLSALGYDAGRPAEQLTPQLRAALSAFQALAMARSAPTGEPDAETTEALQRATTT
jgi:Putative peptidoglycan binding domain